MIPDPSNFKLSIKLPQVRSYAGLIAVRLLLGLCEGGLVPGVVSGQTLPNSIVFLYDRFQILYLSYMYKRNELQSR